MTTESKLLRNFLAGNPVLWEGGKTQPSPQPPEPEESEPESALTAASEDLAVLLETSDCTVKLRDVADLAATHGIAPSLLLGSAEDSEHCWVDYETGMVRCLPEEDDDPSEQQ